MSSRLFLITFLLMIFTPGASHSVAKTGWTQYCGSQSTRCAASQGELCWIGNYGDGLYRINSTTNEVTHFTNLNSGLSSNLVSDLAPGHDNVIWIATDCGISSFDGTTWRVFNRENASFACNSIKSIDIDDEGTLWVSLVGGMYCYKKNQWIDILDKYPGFPLDLLSGATKLTCVGSEVWLQLMDCVVCFKNGAWERLTEVGTISISKDGTRWFLSTKDKALAGMKGTTLELVPVPANCQYGTFFIDPADAKWIYRNDTLYALKADQWLPIVIPPTFRSTSYYSFLKVDDAGNIWLSGQNYLLRYSPVQNEWKSFPVVVNATSQYSGILRMAIDAENHLWTVYSNGVNYFDSSTWKFYNPISEGGYTRGIELDKQGRLNVTSWQNSNTNSLILYSAIKKERNADGFWTANQCTCESNACNNSCFNPADNSWIYLTNTYSFGFRLFLVRDGHSQLLPYPENDSTKLLAGLDVTDNGTLWAQTKGNSLLRYRNGKWENLNIDKSLNPDTITGILGAGGDTVWIGTGKAGLARFDGASWQKFETKLGDKSLLLPLYYDCKRNELWCKILLKCQTFNTFSFKLGQTYVNDGLYCFNGTTGTQHTTVNSGIYDSYITSVAPDQNGIWVASNYGLAYWDRSASVTTLPGSRKTDKFVKMTHRTTYVTINNVLKFHLNTPGTVILSIYNMSGQLIRTEDIGKRNAGLNLIRLSDFNADDYAQNMFIVDVVVKR